MFGYMDSWISQFFVYPDTWIHGYLDIVDIMDTWILGYFNFFSFRIMDSQKSLDIQVSGYHIPTYILLLKIGDKTIDRHKLQA